jgi:hypothetical protein
MICVLCHESGYEPIGEMPGQHRACALRNVLGGIGHLLDHDHFCTVLGDPDAGLDYRTSALLVDELVTRKGVDGVLKSNQARKEDK